MKFNKWHYYYMNVAKISADLSKSKRLKVGAVIVKNNAIISTGYNGLPSGYEPDVLEDDNDVTKPEVIHAELNALLHCSKQGISCQDATLYVTHSPCRHCAALIAQAGIKEVYYLEEYRVHSSDVFEKCKIKSFKLQDEKDV
jgi:dCMP deaminase